MNEREWRKRRRVMRDTTFNRANRFKFSAVKAPRQCQLVLLVEAG
jgi:hypothetical protein